MKNLSTSLNFTKLRVLFAAAAVTLPSLLLMSVAHAATLTSASVSLSDPRPSTVAVKYDVTVSNVSATAIRCIKMQFTANADGTGGVPTGFDSSVAAVAVNTGQSTIFSSHTGYTLTKSTNGTLTYVNASGGAPSVTSGAHFVVDGITNGSQANDDKFVTFSTYNNQDCSTSPIDSVIMGFIYTDGQQVSLTVDPSLTFAVAGVTGNGALAVNGTTITNTLATTSTTIPFGTLSSSTNKVAAQDLTVSTNSGLGYTVSARYTQAPTAGSYTIDPVSGSNASPATFSAAGTEAFGYTTEDTTLGTGTAGRFASNKWAAMTTSNAEIIYHNAAVSNQTTRIGFQTGVSGATEPGAYTTTVIYTATPVY